MNVTNVKSCLNEFNKKCLDEFKKSMDVEYINMCDKMAKEVQENIMTQVGKDLYDYSDVRIHSVVSLWSNNTSIQGGINRCKEYRNFIKKRVSGEKLVLIKSISKRVHSIGDTRNIYGILLTNYGRLCLITTNNNGVSYNTWGTYHELNFWIPKDYIYIIQSVISIISQSICCNNGNPFKQLLLLLKHLKINLSNGKYVKNNIDIKFMDVYKKEQQLSKKEEQFEKQKKKQELKIKKQCEQVKKEREELKKQKEKFKLIAKKIKMEKIKLDNKKKELEKQMLEHVDIDDLIDDMEKN